MSRIPCYTVIHDAERSLTIQLHSFSGVISGLQVEVLRASPLFSKRLGNSEGSDRGWPRNLSVVQSAKLSLGFLLPQL